MIRCATRVTLCLVLLSALAACGPAVPGAGAEARPVDPEDAVLSMTSNPDADAVARAQAAFESDLREAAAIRRPTEVIAGEVDLNGDGRPELVTVLASSFFCGSAGCRTAVLSADDQVLLQANAQAVGLAPGVTNGWRDVLLNEGVTWRFDGVAYGTQPPVN